jgi:cysteinyl-tRNA synthetase
MTDVLGVNPLDPHWAGATTSGQGDATSALDALVQAQLAARQSARAARDFAAADAIRDQLTTAGIAIEDTPSGPRWSLARHPDAAPGAPSVPQPKD